MSALIASGAGARIFSFETVVKYSLTSETSTQAWCSKCHKYQPTVQKKKILRLPHLLSLNCQLDKQVQTAVPQPQTPTPLSQCCCLPFLLSPLSVGALNVTALPFSKMHCYYLAVRATLLYYFHASFVQSNSDKRK